MLGICLWWIIDPRDSFIYVVMVFKLFYIFYNTSLSLLQSVIHFHSSLYWLSGSSNNVNCLENYFPWFTHTFYNIPDAPVVKQTVDERPTYVQQSPQQAPIHVQQQQQQPRAPIYIQEPQQQAPVYIQQAPEQAPVYIQQAPEQAPVYIQQAPEQAPVYIQEAPKQAPIYIQDTPQQAPVYIQQAPQQAPEFRTLGTENECSSPFFLSFFIIFKFFDEK